MLSYFPFLLTFFQQKEKQMEIAAMLGQKLSDEQFAHLVALGEKITDYHDDNREDGDAGFDDDTGVALVFDRDDEADGGMDEADDDDLEVVAEENADSDDDMETEADVVRSNFAGDTVAVDATKVSPRDVDAYWLQRQLSAYSKDAVETQKLADSALSVLQVSLFYTHHGFVSYAFRMRKMIATAKTNWCRFLVLTSSSSSNF